MIAPAMAAMDYGHPAEISGAVDKICVCTLRPGDRSPGGPFAVNGVRYPNDRGEWAKFSWRQQESRIIRVRWIINGGRNWTLGLAGLRTIAPVFPISLDCRMNSARFRSIAAMIGSGFSHDSNGIDCLPCSLLYDVAA